MKHIELINRKPGWQGHDPMRANAEKLLKSDLKLTSHPYSPKSVSSPENTRHRPYKKGGEVSHGHRIPTNLDIPKEQPYKARKPAHINDYYAQGGYHAGEDRGGEAHMKGPGKMNGVQHQGAAKKMGHKKGGEHQKMFWGGMKDFAKQGLNSAIQKGSQMAGEKAAQFAGKHLGEEHGQHIGNMAQSAVGNLGQMGMNKLGSRFGFKKGGQTKAKVSSLRKIEKAHAEEGKLIGKLKHHKHEKHQHHNHGGEHQARAVGHEHGDKEHYGWGGPIGNAVGSIPILGGLTRMLGMKKGGHKEKHHKFADGGNMPTWQKTESSSRLEGAAPHSPAAHAVKRPQMGHGPARMRNAMGRFAKGGNV